MSNSPTITRHYPKVDGLVRRTEADVTHEFLETRTLTTPFLLELFAAKPSTPTLTSSAHGEIQRLLFTIPKYARVYAQLAFAVCQRCVWVFTSPQTVLIMDV